MGDNLDGTFSDGNFEIALPTGPPTFERPFPETDEPYILVQPYMIHGAFWEKLPFATAHPEFTDYKLVQETTPRATGALVEWDRVYAKTPANRRIPETFAWGLQFWTLSSGNFSLSEIAVPILSQVYYAYGTKAEVEARPVLQARRLVLVNNGLYWYGTPDSDLGRVAEDSAIRHWMGHIWEYSARFITVPTIGEAVT